MQSFLWGSLLLIGIITMINGCTDNKQEGITSTETKPQSVPPGPPPANADFYQLRVDSGTLVNTFYLTPPAERFKKLLLSFTVKDYREFPDSLTMLAQGAKMNDDLYVPNCPSILLQIKDTTKVSLPTELLFSTLELPFQKIKNIVGTDGRGRRYREVIFIPFVKDSCGKKYLSYRVQCWPPIGGGAEPSEELNPCPPQKPN